jgi:cytochrome b involved in lipid metabolism
VSPYDFVNSYPYGRQTNLHSRRSRQGKFGSQHNAPALNKDPVESQHNTEDDLWIVIDSKVYDVTKFQKFHPGGRNVLYDPQSGEPSVL